MTRLATLEKLATLVFAMLLSSGAAMADYPRGPRGYKRSDGISAVVYKGQYISVGCGIDHIYERSFVGNQWQLKDLTALTGAPVPGNPPVLSWPTPYVRSDQVNSVVYVGGNGHVYELYSFSGTQWYYGDLTNTAGGAPLAAMSSPAPYINEHGVSCVVYRGTNSHVYQLCNRSRWEVEDLTVLAGVPTGAASTPFPYLRSDGLGAVVYRGTNGHIYELSAAGWADLTLASNAVQASASSQPTPYVRSDHYNSVVYRGIDNHIYEIFSYWWGVWNSGDLNYYSGAPPADSGTLYPYGPPLDSEPFPYVRSDYYNSIVYRANDHHIHEIFASPGGAWQSGDLTYYAQPPPPTYDGPLGPTGYARFDGISSVLYTSWSYGACNNTGDIYELSVSPGNNWQFRDLGPGVTY